jgi:hypothetical protein
VLIPGKAVTVRLDPMLFLAEHETGKPWAGLLVVATVVLFLALVTVFVMLRRETRSRRRRQQAATDPDHPPR